MKDSYQQTIETLNETRLKAREVVDLTQELTGAAMPYEKQLQALRLRRMSRQVLAKPINWYTTPETCQRQYKFVCHSLRLLQKMRTI